MHGYYAPLRAMLETAFQQGFVRPALAEVLQIDDDLDRLLGRMQAAELPALEQWLETP